MTENNQVAKIDDTTPAALPDANVIPPSLNLTKLNNLRQITFIGKMMAQSGMFADLQRDPAKAIVKIIAGQEMGIPPVEACRGLDIIQGEVAIGAGLMAAKIKASPKYNYKVKRWDNDGCEIEFFERNEETGKLETAGLSSFTRKDAETAGLTGKENYRKWPRNMFFSRAMSNGQSIYAPDIFQVGTVYTKEELDDRTELAEEVTDDQPAAALPPTATPAVADAPDNAPAGSEGSDPDESDVNDTPPPKKRNVKDALAEAGKLLTEKGFGRSEALQIIACIAGVEDASELTGALMARVLETVNTESAAALAHYLPASDQPNDNQEDDGDPGPTPPPAEEKSVAQALADGDPEPPKGFLAKEDEPAKAPHYVVPAYKKGSSQLVRPDMIKLYKKWCNLYGLKTPEAVGDMARATIGKPAPATFDDYVLLLQALADALNTADAQRQELV